MPSKPGQMATLPLPQYTQAKSISTSALSHLSNLYQCHLWTNQSRLEMLRGTVKCTCAPWGHSHYLHLCCHLCFGHNACGSTCKGESGKTDVARGPTTRKLIDVACISSLTIAKIKGQNRKWFWILLQSEGGLLSLSHLSSVWGTCLKTPWEVRWQGQHTLQPSSYPSGCGHRWRELVHVSPCVPAEEHVLLRDLWGKRTLSNHHYRYASTRPGAKLLEKWILEQYKPGENIFIT